MIIVLFGQPHSGKSTLAKEFSTYRNIDGDRLRELFTNKDYSKVNELITEIICAQTGICPLC